MYNCVHINIQSIPEKYHLSLIKDEHIAQCTKDEVRDTQLTNPQNTFFCYFEIKTLSFSGDLNNVIV